MRRPFIIAGILVLLLPVLTGCGAFFFHPSRVMQEGPAVKLYAHRDVEFRSADGVALHGWYFPARDARGSILVLHGNAQNLSNHVNSVLWLVPAGFNILIVDYRGYGRSGGSPAIAGVHRDAAAALETLFGLPGTDPDRVAVLGQSLGGSIALYTVATSPRKERIRAVVIEGAFSGYRRIAREKAAGIWLTWPFQYPIAWTIDDDYSAVRWAAKVAPVPLLILHGMEDAVVPPHHSRHIFEAAGEPKELWPTATPGHVMSFADAEVRDRLVQYLDRVLGPRDAAQPRADHR